MKTKSRSASRHHFNWWKIATLLIVVLASVYLIGKYFFDNSKNSEAGWYPDYCCSVSSDCEPGYKCVKRSNAGKCYSTGGRFCEPEKAAGGMGKANLKCDCNTEFGPCNYGYKIRLCTFNLSGKDKCNYAAANGTLIQAVACNN